MDFNRNFWLTPDSYYDNYNEKCNLIIVNWDNRDSTKQLKTQIHLVVEIKTSETDTNNMVNALTQQWRALSFVSISSFTTFMAVWGKQLVGGVWFQWQNRAARGQETKCMWPCEQLKLKRMNAPKTKSSNGYCHDYTKHFVSLIETPTKIHIFIKLSCLWINILIKWP